jgi:uncharacterized protein (TIGR02231 family)
MDRMRTQFIYGLIASAALAPWAVAQDVETTPINADVPAASVTVYRGRAAITRRIELDLTPGAYVVTFDRLPDSIQPDTLQARSSGDAKILGVSYEELDIDTSSAPEPTAFDERISELNRQIEDLAGRTDVVKAQEAFLDAFAQRAAVDAADARGTEGLDLASVREQLTFIAEERTRLLEMRQAISRQSERTSAELAVIESRRAALTEASPMRRAALVSTVVTSETRATIELAYLVTNASWEPTYRVRASVDSSKVAIEYNAIVTQRTGEDWNQVAMTLSTAQPLLAANPPQLQPWFVDQAEDSGRRTTLENDTFEPQFKALGAMQDKGRVDTPTPSVTYRLPRPVTVQSNVQKLQQAPIAWIETSPEFMHVAVPQLREAVYIRGRMANTSQYLLLPGRVAIFLEQDYVGATQLGSIMPQGQFELFFGVDQTVRVARILLSKSTSKTGLLAGGRETSYEYQIDIDNGAGKVINMELWDRYPISRSDEIEIELVDLNVPLATDSDFINEHEPLGLMKWTLMGIPATAYGPNAMIINYGLTVNRAKDVVMTPLPE